MASTILATYRNEKIARDVIDELHKAGFKQKDIGFAVADPKGHYAADLNEGERPENMTGGDGAASGSIMGTLIGAVAGLFAITIPGVGPIVAAGPLAALGGAAAGAGIGAAGGAATGGLTGALMDMGVSEEDAEIYSEAVRRGGALVSVTIHNDDEGNRTRDILRRHNPIDIDAHRTQWRKSGWEGFDENADPYTAEELAKERAGYTYDEDYEYSQPPVRRYQS